MPSLLEAKSLVRSFGERRVVDEVSLALEQGQVLGLLGPNGAGKTTTFRMIAGLLKPDRGSVLIDGEDVTKMPLYRRASRGLGYLAQRRPLPRLGRARQLLVAGEIAGLSTSEAGHRAEEVMERLKLSHVADGRETTLSGGERRRRDRTSAHGAASDAAL